jgi:hypothetical protein
LAEGVVVVEAVDAGPIAFFGFAFGGLGFVRRVMVIKHKYGRLLNKVWNTYFIY